MSRLWRALKKPKTTPTPSKPDGYLRGYYDGVGAARSDRAYRDFIDTLAAVVEAAGGSVAVDRRALVDPPELTVAEDIEHGFTHYTTRRSHARPAK